MCKEQDWTSDIGRYGMWSFGLIILCCAESLSHVRLFANPMDCSPPCSFFPGDSPGKNTGVDCLALLQGNLSDPVIKLGSPALEVDSLPAKLPGKPLIILLASFNAQRQGHSKWGWICTFYLSGKSHCIIPCKGSSWDRNWRLMFRTSNWRVLWTRTWT